jgi:hypothetical protein
MKILINILLIVATAVHLLKLKSIRILMDSIRSYSGTVFYSFCFYIKKIGSRIVTYYLYYCLLFFRYILHFLFFQTITTYCELILHKVKSFCLKTLYYIILTCWMLLLHSFLLLYFLVLQLIIILIFIVDGGG